MTLKQEKQSFCRTFHPHANAEINSMVRDSIRKVASGKTLMKMNRDEWDEFKQLFFEKVKSQTKAAQEQAVNHPPHYTNHPSGIECIDVTRHMNFNTGNAMKYIWRADLKNDPIEDLKKAIWYLNDEIKRRENLINQQEA